MSLQSNHLVIKDYELKNKQALKPVEIIKSVAHEASDQLPSFSKLTPIQKLNEFLQERREKKRYEYGLPLLP